MLLVDADQPESMERREHGRPRADHDRSRARRDPLAFVAALGLGERRVEDRHPVAEARPEAADRLRRERDLRDEDDHAEPSLERSRRRLEVHLGLPAPSGSVEKEVPAVFERLAKPGDGALLRCRQAPRLRLAWQRVALGRLRELLPSLSPRWSDERKRAAGRRAVVVGEPERKLDERRGQRLFDPLDRRGVHALGRRVLQSDDDAALLRASEAHRNHRPPLHVVGRLVCERTR